MVARLFFFLFRLPLFSAVSSATIALAAAGQTVVYPIDAGQRGTEIINTFNAILPRTTGATTPAVYIQTSLPSNLSSSYLTYRYMANGLVPYVQGIRSTPFNTLLIVTYLSSQLASTPQYIVLPVEYVSTVLSFPFYQNLPSSGTFNTTFPSGSLPFFSVDPRERARDIVEAFTQLKEPNYATNTSQVWIQTGLSGPFNPYPNDFSHLLKNVTSISITSDSTGATSLLYVQFTPPAHAPQQIVLCPEQVQQIIYVLNPQSP